jgi:integrase
VDGEQKRRQGFVSREEAQAALGAYKAEVTASPVTAAPSMTLGAAIERYLTTQTNRGNARSAEDHRLAAHLKKVFGAGTPLASITAARVAEYRDGRLGAVSERSHRPLTAAAVNRPLALLRGLLTKAVEEWEVLPSVPKIKLAREPQGRIRWLEPEEESRLMEACTKSQNRALSNIVRVAVETGLRRGELLGLNWDRLDMTRGVIRLEITKSGRRREVPMRQVVYDVLSKLPGVHEGQVWPAGSIRTAWETAVDAAKLDDFHFHDLRHTFASRYVMRGGSLPALQAILGHATLAMTMKYSHLSPTHLREEMAKTEVPRVAPVEAPAAQRQHMAPTRV